MPRSQLERVWLIGGLLVGLIVALLAYVVLIGPQRSHTSQVNQSVDSARSQNTTLQFRINALTAQNKDLAKYQNALKQAELALPSTSGLPDFLRTLQSIGTATSTDVTQLTVGSPTDLSAAGSASTAASTTVGKPSASSSAKIFALPITAQVTGSDAQLNDFLVQLQSVQPRAVLISQISEGAVNTTGTTVKGSASNTLQLTMQAFVSPSSSVEAAALAKAAGK